MTCENCLMFTHCRYDLEGTREKPCKHFIDKLNYSSNKNIELLNEEEVLEEKRNK